METVKTAVITGGHSYDVPSFHQLFRSLDEIEAYIQHMDDFASSRQEVRDSYDVALFYIMMPGIPQDEGLPWYSGKPRTALEHLGETDQGIVILHHAILAYRDWDEWSELVGIQNLDFTFHIGENLRVDIADPDHPITQELSPWEMIDETYHMESAGEGSHALLTTDHPKSMRVIGWTRQYKKSRVFCLELGHDNRTWTDPNFREVLQRGISWAARKLS